MHVSAVGQIVYIANVAVESLVFAVLLYNPHVSNLKINVDYGITRLLIFNLTLTMKE